MNNKPLFLIIGPSGSGKTTIVRALAKKHGLKVATSYTTRAKRPGEEDGFDHHFVSDEEFDRLDNLHAMHEIGKDRYGTSEEEIDNSDLYIVDLSGAEYVKRHWAGKRKLVVIALYVEPAVSRKRMLERGDSEEVIQRRLAEEKLAFRSIEGKCNIMLDAGLPKEALEELLWSCMQAYITAKEKGEK